MDETSFSRLIQETFSLNPSQAHEEWKFFALFEKEADNLNLTGLKDQKDRLIKLLVDSLYVRNFVSFENVKTVLDLGTGGGFPGLPLALLSPDQTFTLVDSRKKKIEAIKRMRDAMKLLNVVTEWTRAEDMAGRESFDLVLTRAFAPLNKAARLVWPLVNKGGRAVFYLGPQEDLAEGRYRRLFPKGTTTEVFAYALPEGMGERRLLVVTRNH